ncbi:MAG: zinc-binding alcohol dehydrogenase family protein [Phycisphaeraceae bacterium]|nr:zinc-binding alcohol dehydrogenase family protein [Phycisphaeraceae bacterium]
MKTLYFDEPKKIRTTQTDTPGDPGPGQAQVKTHRVGVCGTDLGGYMGKMPFFKYPRIPGHELGVEVVAVGEGVNNVKVGDKCAIEPYMNCGKCYPCLKGNGNCCINLEVIGVMSDGGLRERFNIRADKLHVGNKLSYEQLALVETLAIGCHAIDRGNVQEGDGVLIIGAGPIGLSALEFAKVKGARLAVMDLSQDRLDFCKKTYGIECGIVPEKDGSEMEQVNAFTDGNGFSIVVDATGHNGSMSNAMRYCAPTGGLVYVGITKQDLVFPHIAIHKPEVTILPSRNALPKDFPYIIDLIEKGTINTAPWITRRMAFDDVLEQFAELITPAPGTIKTIIEMN